MPHKRNPVLSENVTGLARMVRAYALPAMEDVALWHPARYLPFLGGAHDWPRRHRDARLRAGTARLDRRQAHRLSRSHAGISTGWAA